MDPDPNLQKRKKEKLSFSTLFFFYGFSHFVQITKVLFLTQIYHSKSIDSSTSCT